jgi:hypothetical protein
MSDERATDEKGRPLDYMTEFGLYCGVKKQFPNRTVLNTPSQHLSYNVKKSLDRVAENNASKNAGCWGKKK